MDQRQLIIDLIKIGRSIGQTADTIDVDMGKSTVYLNQDLEKIFGLICKVANVPDEDEYRIYLHDTIFEGVFSDTWSLKSADVADVILGGRDNQTFAEWKKFHNSKMSH